MQYVVHAYDFPDALERRLAVRETHLAGVRKMKEDGTFILGGALLSPEGVMIGSMMLLEFAEAEAVQAWLDAEIYIAERVWDRVDIKPFRMAAV